MIVIAVLLCILIVYTSWLTCKCRVRNQNATDNRSWHQPWDVASLTPEGEFIVWCPLIPCNGRCPENHLLKPGACALYPCVSDVEKAFGQTKVGSKKPSTKSIFLLKQSLQNPQRWCIGQRWSGLTNGPR